MAAASHDGGDLGDCPPTPPILDAKAATPTRSDEADGGPGTSEQTDKDGRDAEIAVAGSGSRQREPRDAHSPEPNCAICIGELQNMAYTDSCFHKFCFTCLLEWSRVRPVCPLCKVAFKHIIHTIKSDDNYESYEVPPLPTSAPASSAQRGSLQLASFEAFMDREARFAYRTTMTRERLQQRSEALMRATGYVLPSLPPPVPSQSASTSGATASIQWIRRRGVATSEFRRDIYRRGLWVIADSLNDVTGRVRETSPEWYRANLAQTHRLVPWLNREVNALLGDSRQVPSNNVVDQIIDLVQRHEIRSPEFQARLLRYFGANTSHFQHEFYHFARSVYDMVGFDMNARYTERVPVPERPPPEPVDPGTVVIDSSSSSSDDDGIEVIAEVRRPRQQPGAETSGIGNVSRPDGASALDLTTDRTSDQPLVPLSSASRSDLVSSIRDRLERQNTLSPMLANLMVPFLEPTHQELQPSSYSAISLDQPSTSSGAPSANFSHLVIPDSTTTSSDDEPNAVQVVDVVPPRHLRPPMAVIDIVSSDDSTKEDKAVHTEVKAEDGMKATPLASGTSTSSSSSRKSRKLEARKTVEDRIRKERNRTSSSSSSSSPDRRRKSRSKIRKKKPSAASSMDKPKATSSAFKGKGKGRGKGKSNRHLEESPSRRNDHRKKKSSRAVEASTPQFHPPAFSNASSSEYEREGEVKGSRHLDQSTSERKEQRKRKVSSVKESTPPPRSLSKCLDTTSSEDEKPLASRFVQHNKTATKRKRNGRRVVLAEPTSEVDSSESSMEETMSSRKKSKSGRRVVVSFNGPAMDKAPWEIHNLTGIDSGDLRHKLVRKKENTWR